MSYYTLGLFGVCAGLVVAGCGDDGNTGGSNAGGNASGGSAQGAGPQGAGSEGGSSQGGASQGGSSQGGSSQGGSSQGGSSQGGSAQGGSSQGGASQGGSSQGGAGQGGGGTGGAGGSPPAFTCQTGCEALFDCALENDSGGNQNCPGLQASDQALVVPSCVSQCNNTMALLALIDPSDCEGTINTISNLSAQFDNACQNGF